MWHPKACGGSRQAGICPRGVIGTNDQPRIVGGPLAETRARVAGYVLIQLRTREEAVEWSRRYPNPTLHRPMPYPARLMTIFVDIDKPVGKEFETGLASLKA